MWSLYAYLLRQVNRIFLKYVHIVKATTKLYNIITNVSQNYENKLDNALDISDFAAEAIDFYA
jgi:hypothetical protein